MRIIVISDSHGRRNRIEEALAAQKNARYVFFLGDTLSDIDAVREFFPDHTFYAVAGNCDFSRTDPTVGSVTLCGKRIIYTHGHEFGVKLSLSRLMDYAKARHADILLYGHTHRAEAQYDDGMYIVNPGSIGKGQPPSYAVIDIEPNGILPIITDRF